MIFRFILKFLLISFCFFFFKYDFFIKCITGKKYLSLINKREFSKNHNPKISFITFKNKYELINTNKKYINKNLLIKKVRLNELYLKDSKNGIENLNNNFLNRTNETTVTNPLNNKKTYGIFNLIKYLFTGGLLLTSFLLAYMFFLNKKIDIMILNVFKEKLFFLNILKKRKNFYTIPSSFQEFISSPLFFSTILISSYSIYIILKVFIEKYKETKRIKSAIESYNKSKNDYINTGIDDSSNNEDDLNSFDNLEK